jgi:UDP-glucose 4-epimerase
LKDTHTILFLGGAGFLGLNVLEHYFNNDKDNLRRFIVVTRSSRDNDFLKKKEVDNIVCEFSAIDRLENLFKDNKINEVFHFISTSVPATSNSNVIHDINSNLISTINLLNLMVKYHVKKITYLSSGGTVYGDPHAKRFQEQESYKLKSSYGIVKFATEKYIELYKELYNIQYLIIRPSNLFGLNHTSKVNGLINLAIRKNLKNENLTIWGDGTTQKDYIFSKDFASIFWQLHKLNVQNIILNVGSGVCLSIDQVLNLIKEIIPGLTWKYTKEKDFDTKVVDFRLDQLKSIMPISNTDILQSIAETYEWEKLRSEEGE